MKTTICCSSLFVLVTIMALNIGPSIEDIFPLSKNFFIFERVTCRTYDGSKASAMHCRIKYIDRNHLKGLVTINITEPATELWLHGIFYYKYNTYMKIATELRDDVCGWLEGKKKSFFLDFLKPQFQKYSNFNHTCPYSGLLFGKVDNISVQEFAPPQIMPAGRYRFDFNMTEGSSRTLFYGGSIYFAISDHRIEIV